MRYFNTSGTNVNGIVKRGVYLVFVRSTITNPKVKEGVDTIDGVVIKTHIVRYDLKTDFKAPKGLEDDDDDDD